MGYLSNIGHPLAEGKLYLLVISDLRLTDTTFAVSILLEKKVL